VAAPDLLQQVPIFAGVEPEQLEDLAKHAREIEVPAGEELTHEGRYEGYVFVVLSGTVAIERDGRQVDTIGPGDFFGEIAAVDGGPRTATARTLEDARLVTVPHEPFYELMDAVPDVRAAVMEAMEQRLARMDSEGSA
jgi:CRP/FNR family transcriptional regulator, cyclic AMP receptor protein